ncbi:IS701 family transposase [bacterium]|nr:IS701 family transposase [bacterium]
MERRFAVRYEELMKEAEVKPETLEGVLGRLKEFVRPFAASLTPLAQRDHLEEYVAGLVSNVKRKNIETIAYLHEQDRQPLQKFIGQKPWRWQPLIGELARQIGAALGEADGVLVIDPSGVLKQGKASVGVARQWCGRAGKVDNCQVGVYLGYVTRREHALVDTRLYLPKEWTQDKQRCKRAGVPKEVGFRTRHELALEMLREHRGVLPHAWVTGDDEMGRSSGFRKELRGMKERYLLAVPSNTLVRDLDATPPPYSGSGQPPKVPFQRADGWMKTAKNWTRIEVRAGEKGPLVVEAVKARVQTKLGRRNGPEETLVIFRERQGRKTIKHDYCLSDAPFDTPLRDFARVLGAEHRIEECLRRAKGETGLAQYQVRTWEGWHHHQTLALIATWFLTQEKRRGEKGIAMSVRPGVANHHRTTAA